MVLDRNKEHFYRSQGQKDSCVNRPMLRGGLLLKMVNNVQCNTFFKEYPYQQPPWSMEPFRFEMFCKNLSSNPCREIASGEPCSPLKNSFKRSLLLCSAGHGAFLNDSIASYNAIHRTSRKRVYFSSNRSLTLHPRQFAILSSVSRRHFTI